MPLEIGMTNIVLAISALVLLCGSILYFIFRPGTGRMQPPTHDEISDLLIENTVIGEWNGDPYRQYFMADGTTFYAAKGKRSTRGKWRVSADGNSYESWWTGPDTNWESFSIMRTNEGLAWVDSAGVIYPFNLLTGEQLVWEE